MGTVGGRFLSTGLGMLLFLATVVPLGAETGSADKFLAMGTGSRSGVFYPVGYGICELLNADRLRHGYRCRAYNTGAALYNINALNSREMDLGITYANLAQNAFLGTGLFEHLGPNPSIRSIAGLYDNVGGIVVRKSSGITTFDDLKGHRINIGNAGAGGRTIADLVWKAAGWQEDDFEEVLELSLNEGKDRFCRGDVDILIQAVAVPSAFFNEVTNDCDGMFIDLPADILDNVLSASPYLGQGVIPGGTYRNNPGEASIVLIPVVLVTSSRIHPDAIYTLTNAIFSDVGRFRSIHPVLGTTSRQRMIDKGQFLPFHAGAIRFFQETVVPAEDVGEIFEITEAADEMR